MNHAASPARDTPRASEGPRALAYATRVEEARPERGEDRIAAVELPGRTMFVVADGAGGVAGGAAASRALCDALGTCADHRPTDWAEWLAGLDRAMAASGPSGLAAAVVVEIGDDGSVVGASVGDCEAWIFGEGEPRSLTGRQIRKPLVGGGDAEPVGFASHIHGGRLVVASDGLWKYMSHLRIAEAASLRPIDLAATALVDGVRLRNGALQDDVAVLVCEAGRR